MRKRRYKKNSYEAMVLEKIKREREDLRKTISSMEKEVEPKYRKLPK